MATTPLSHTPYPLCDRALLVPTTCDQFCAHYVIGSLSHIMIRQKSFVIRQKVKVAWRQ